MGERWLLDITEERTGREVRLWLKGTDGTVTSRTVAYRPPFFVDGARDALEGLAGTLADDPRVERTELRRMRATLFEHRPRPLLAVVPTHNAERKRLAGSIDALGGYVRFMLYDVDLTPPQLYHLEHGLYPFAPVVIGPTSVTATEPAETLEYVAPPLRSVPFAVELSEGRRDGIVRADDTIRRLRLGPVLLE
ncbi:MAG TPA: hypothetical protein VGV89_00920, partial [Thermoplasmata archaeon]|nr:hypothetical protein [Thermoplasmata archaeon]